MNDAMFAFSQVWEGAKTLSNFGGFGALVTYAFTQLRKKFQKPDLAAAVELIGRTRVAPCHDITPIENGSLHTPNGYCDIQQEWALRITNNSEYSAFKLHLIAPTDSTWIPEIDYTTPVLSHQTILINTYIKIKLKVDFGDADYYRRKPAMEQIKIAYQNSVGKRYCLIFCPNEPDVIKRNQCIKL